MSIQIIFVNIDDQGLYTHYGIPFNDIDEAERFYKNNFDNENECRNSDSVINLHTGIFVIINNSVKYYYSDSYEWFDYNTKENIFDYLRKCLT